MFGESSFLWIYILLGKLICYMQLIFALLFRPSLVEEELQDVSKENTPVYNDKPSILTLRTKTLQFDIPSGMLHDKLRLVL